MPTATNGHFRPVKYGIYKKGICENQPLSVYPVPKRKNFRFPVKFIFMEINQPASKFQDASLAPMHTAEHILNQAMIRMFGCERSRNNHIEKKKSKCDYLLPTEPDAATIQTIEDRVNEVIGRHLSVTAEFISRDQVPAGVDLSKLPGDAGETLRMVRIGDYDLCACIGTHVSNTAEIGKFRIISTDYENNRLRIRFKLQRP